MTKSSLTLILTFCVSLGAACAHDDFVGPRPGERVLTRLEITPDKIVLPPRGSSQLTIKAWDQFGTPMLQGVEWADKTSYLSGSPQVVQVSSSGLVTAVALGTAEVAATLTLGGVTRTTSTVVTVAEPAFPPGVYDLTAPVSHFDDAWGDLTDYRFTGVITFPRDAAEGTWENFRLIDPTGKPSDWVGSGTLTTYIARGEAFIDLVANGFHFSLIAPVQDALDSRLVRGRWECCASTSGTFTAIRRE